MTPPQVESVKNVVKIFAKYFTGKYSAAGGCSHLVNKTVLLDDTLVLGEHKGRTTDAITIPYDLLKKHDSEDNVNLYECRFESGFGVIFLDWFQIEVFARDNKVK